MNERAPSPPEDDHENGVRLFQAEKYAEAAVAFGRAVVADPRSGKAHHNLGVSLRILQRYEEAIASFQRALEFGHVSPLTFHNAGLALRSLGNMREAVRCFERALAMKPDHAEAANALGVTFADLKQRTEAIAAFTRALEINPRFALARAQRLHQQAFLCDWDGIAADAPYVSSLGIEGDAVPPFSLLSIEDAPARHRRRAERFGAERMRIQQPSFLPPSVRPPRLRLGYFSADFHEHAVAFLIARLFELHNPLRFEVHAISFGPDKADAMRERICAGVPHFHDVRPMSDSEITDFARAKRLDIAVDLSGWTQNNRAAIFASRVAPIQINYLGYPGTSGAPFMDYIIADATIIPADARAYYSESIIYLPHSYQANDDLRFIASRTPTRSEEGLPDRGLVFCCFNNAYKITPAEFDIWMRLMLQVPDSVLWLLKPDAPTADNLRREGQARGVDPARIIFADRRPPADHLARYRLADLFLDTFNYNAHTTGSDALWAGLPVLTKLGQSFAARVGGSLLRAVELPELVTASEEEYERLALDLARNPDRLQSLRDRLKDKHTTAPLFNSALFTTQIEDAYEQVYQRHLEGNAPDTITVN